MGRLNRLNGIVAVMLAAACIMPRAASAASVVELQGRGVQIYSCAASATGFAWKLKAPEATLFDTLGQVSGRHFAGPSWQANDGSVVVGEILASGSGDAGTIPWLLLRAKTHAGQGIFAAVGYIVRGHTTGGVPPTAGCDARRQAAEIRVPYRADYIFFPGRDPASP